MDTVPYWYNDPVCHYCQNTLFEGGDIVPYGSTTTQLPEYIVCGAGWLEGDDDFIDSMTGLVQSGALRSCPHYAPCSLCIKHYCQTSRWGCPECEKEMWREFERDQEEYERG